MRKCFECEEDAMYGFRRCSLHEIKKFHEARKK